MIDKPLFIILKDMAILQFINEFILYYMVTPEYNLTGILSPRAIETFKKLINTNVKREAYNDFRLLMLDLYNHGRLEANILEIVRINKDCYMEYRESLEEIYKYYDIDYGSYLDYFNL